jgi:hypothetical protein
MPRTVARKAAAVLVDDAKETRGVPTSYTDHSTVLDGRSDRKSLAKVEAEYTYRLG